MTNDLSLIGSLSWTEFRAFLIKELEKARTEKEFLDVIKMLFLATGTIDEIIEKRKSLNLSIDDLLKKKEELEKI